MVDLQKSHDPFLMKMNETERSELQRTVEAWNLPFDPLTRVADWIRNFDPQDKPLAVKVLRSMTYLAPDAFGEQLRRTGNDISKILAGSNLTLADALIVLPDNPIDSGRRHAYDVSKVWQLRSSQFKALSIASSDEHSASPVVVFNDTHGSGRQLIKELGKYPSLKERRLIISGIVMGQGAIDAYTKEFPLARIVPGEAFPTIRNYFSEPEVRRLRELGSKVYPSHPLGYGESELLVAYYFQCPNNTLPIIWADGRNNAERNSDRGFPWQALFPYLPKNDQTSPSPEVQIGAQGHNMASPSDSIAPSPSHEPAARQIFLHFLDHYFLEQKRAADNEDRVRRECAVAARLALLAADELLVSMASYIESSVCKKVLDELVPLFETGEVRAVGKGPTLHEYLRRKLEEYPRGSLQRARYAETPLALPIPLLSLERSASEYIKRRWISVLDSDYAGRLFSAHAKILPHNIERVWEAIPERLGDAAFIVGLVGPKLVSKKLDGQVPESLASDLHRIINPAYFDSIIDEVPCGIVTDLVYLHDPRPVSKATFSISYTNLCRSFRDAGLLDSIIDASPKELLALKRNDRVRSIVSRHTVE